MKTQLCPSCLILPAINILQIRLSWLFCNWCMKQEKTHNSLSGSCNRSENTHLFLSLKEGGYNAMTKSRKVTRAILIRPTLKMWKVNRLGLLQPHGTCHRQGTALTILSSSCVHGRGGRWQGLLCLVWSSHCLQQGGEGGHSSPAVLEPAPSLIPVNQLNGILRP